MPPTKFWLNLAYCLRADVVWRFSRWPPSWILEQNDFSNSESPCHSNAFHQVSVQTDLWFGRRCGLKNFQDDHHRGHLGYQNKTILAILNLHVTLMPPTKLGLIRISFRMQMWFEYFQDGYPCSHLGYQKGKILAFLNLYVPLMPPIKFQLNLT